ncbi:RICIN domain-containing protein [Streptomyces sp. S1]|uniref:RICIN domain-containing protein n=1 Tax=Streptomyces sp. S1 TaxID=718288 RepID=UPI001969E3CE|nr:RICIN domain-containing protein [Streptomyces sp. S1]
MARNSGKCLEASGTPTEDGAPVVQKTCGSAKSQHWKIEPEGDAGHSRLVARHGGKCLDVADYAYADGAALDQWTCNGGHNQQWERTIA